MAVHAYLLAGVFNPSPHSGGDNAGYLTLAFSLLDRHEYLELWDPAAPPHTKYPPVFASVLAAAMALGARTWSAFKVISTFAIWGSVGLSVLWARHRYGWGLALAGGALLALSGALLYASQWILSDPLFLLLTMAALVGFDRAKPKAWSGWMVLACVATVAAFFTRSAGLPLVVAAGTWLMLQRRGKAAFGFAAFLGVPALLWWMRSQQFAGPGYTGEFWMVNPYQPDLGRIGFLGLFGRLGENTVQYVGTHLPVALVGTWPLAWLLGVLLLGFALVGWGRRLSELTVTELFVPLYFGLVLLWPPVWSGDRFALPLLPFLVYYAGDTVAWLVRKTPMTPRIPLYAMLVTTLLVPATLTWQNQSAEAAACRARSHQGAFACYTPRMQEFVDAAEWSSVNLPDSSVVLTRKPRLFYLLSGVPSRIFPFSQEPDALAQVAQEAGADYTIIDYLDNIAAFYQIPALQARPTMFCTLRSFGGDARGIRTELLGLRAAQGEASTPRENESGTMSLSLDPCPPSMVIPGGEQEPPAQSSSGKVPLLLGLDP